MFEPIGPPPLSKGVIKLLTLWCMLLPLWFLSALAAGGFRTYVGGHLFVIAWILYPVLLWMAFFFKRSRPYLTLLPALSFVVMVISSELDDLLRHV